MDPIPIGIGILIIGAIAAGFVWIQRSEATASERRRTSMMKRVGIDPKLVALDDPKTRTIGELVRRRCRRCAHEDVCERWLAGEVEGDNAFCPNAETFRSLSEAVANTNDDEKAA